MAGYDKIGNLKRIENFKNFCSSKFHNKYDYSLVSYRVGTEKVKIICPIHGEFEMVANDHKNSRIGCRKCGIDSKRVGLEKFIERATNVHGEKYDYSRIKTVDNISSTKVEILCKKHGSFYQTPEMHMTGQGCSQCYSEIRGKSNILSQETVLERLISTHGQKYDFSKVNFTRTSVKIEVVCPSHGSFFSNFNNLVSGSGCPRCKASKGENKISQYLINNNILFIAEFFIQEGNRYNSGHKFDFYLPDVNKFIEFQGIQHYKPVAFFGGESAFRERQIKDTSKYFIAAFDFNLAEIIEVPYFYIDRIDEYLDYKLKGINND